MASAAPSTTKHHTNYGRMCRMLVELGRDMLWELLVSKIPAADLPNEINRNVSKLHLSSAQYTKLCRRGTHSGAPVKTDVDISCLYTLLRNLCCRKIKPPTQGWVDSIRENYPQKGDTKIADDIERIRQKRNVLYAHATEATIPETLYVAELQDFREIAKRMDGRLRTKFEQFLTNLESCSMDPEVEKECIDELIRQKKNDDETREMVEKVEKKVNSLSKAVEEVAQHAKGAVVSTQKVAKANADLTANVEKLSGAIDDQKGNLGALSGRFDELALDTKGVVASTKQLDKAHTKTFKSVEKMSKKITKQQGKMRQLKVCGKENKKLTEELVSKVADVERNHECVKAMAKKGSDIGLHPSINIVQNIENRDTFSTESTENDPPTADKVQAGEEPAPLTYAAVVTTGQNKCQSERSSHTGNVRNINQVNINVNYNTKSTDKDTTFKPKRIELENFSSSCNQFRDGHFILISGVTEREKYLESLALVPWTAVFDLDPNSRTTGLLSVIEDKFLSLTKRSLNINCLDDRSINKVNERSAHWMFCRGCRENSNSKQDYTFHDWMKNEQINCGMKSFMKKLKDFSKVYTSYKVIVLWPKEEQEIEFIFRLLEKLDKYIGPDIILVQQDSPATELGSIYQKLISRQFERNLTSVRLQLEDMCTLITSYQSSKFGLTQPFLQLPTNDKTNKVDISPKQESWLEEDLSVLYLNKHKSSQRTPKQLKEECDSFFKGGTLPWDIWYELDSGHLDAKRDLMEDIVKTIQQHVNQHHPVLLTLLHAPGSGGTTLAQRILWEMRRITPCAQAKLRTNSTVDDLVNRIEFLYEKTNCPILLMVDGEEEQKVEHLVRRLRKSCVIVLYVKRYPYHVKLTPENTFWLKRTVNINEANVLALKFESQCDSDEKKKSIEKLATDVKKGKERYIFEFGLATYTYQYQGIEAYVKGYLQLPREKMPQLLPWQLALARLSLAYYYGHIGIPCQYFSEIAEKSASKTCKGKVPSIEDFPEEMQSLIVRDTTENKTNIIRISHYYVAKEILEQVLPWPEERLDKRLDVLCIANKGYLEKFAIDFIKHTEVKDKSEQSTTISMIVAKIFIIREEKVMSDRDKKEQRKQGRLSEILKDLDSKPVHTETFSVMKQLTKSFPKNPHYLAHLGRLYALLKPEEVEEAERCFQKALQLCKSLTKGQTLEEMSHQNRLTFTITHFMYGNMYKRQMGEFSRSSIYQQTPNRRISKEKFDEVAKRLLELVNDARGHFQKSREYDPDVYNKNWAYLGEIQACLMFCDYVYKRGGYQDIIKFIEENDSAVSGFAEECIYQIDELFLEFFSSVDPDDTDESVVSYQKWYCALFQNGLPTPGRVVSKQRDDIHSRRLQIATLKLKNRKDNMYGVLESIQNEADIESIVQMYEENFADVHERDIEIRKSLLEQDYKEWLIAIRHKAIKQPYSLEKVLTHVQKWSEAIHTPQSKFYLFVLKSLLGFGNEHSLGNTQLLVEAQQMKNDITKQTRYMSKSKYASEWLGNEDGIRQLACGPRFFGNRNDKDCDKSGRISAKKLALMKGTIKHPHVNPRAGYISLDLGKANNVPVVVFFVPANFQMNFHTYSQQRIEFNIGFTHSHGYEAFNIKPLQKIACQKCQMSVEVTSLDDIAVCPCGEKFTIKHNKK